MEQDKRSLNRRQVCLGVAALPAALAVAASMRAFGADAPKAGAPAASAPAGGLKLVADTDPVAKALGYVHDASTATRIKKGAVEGKDQHCGNCKMYTKQGDLNGKEVGKCQMINGGSVAVGGWCKSWIPKT